MRTIQCNLIPLSIELSEPVPAGETQSPTMPTLNGAIVISPQNFTMQFPPAIISSDSLQKIAGKRRIEEESGQPEQAIKRHHAVEKHGRAGQRLGSVSSSTRKIMNILSSQTASRPQIQQTRQKPVETPTEKPIAQEFSFLNDNTELKLDFSDTRVADRSSPTT